MSVTVDQLVQASGLSPLFAKSAIQRAVDRCGVSLDRLTSADAERLHADLRKIIGIFAPDDIEAASARLRAVLRVP
jgi:hypothetical protein